MAEQTYADPVAPDPETQSLAMAEQIFADPDASDPETQSVTASLAVSSGPSPSPVTCANPHNPSFSTAHQMSSLSYQSSLIQPPLTPNSLTGSPCIPQNAQFMSQYNPPSTDSSSQQLQTYWIATDPPVNPEDPTSTTPPHYEMATGEGRFQYTTNSFYYQYVAPEGLNLNPDGPSTRYTENYAQFSNGQETGKQIQQNRAMPISSTVETIQPETIQPLEVDTSYKFDAATIPSLEVDTSYQPGDAVKLMNKYRKERRYGRRVLPENPAETRRYRVLKDPRQRRRGGKVSKSQAKTASPLDISSNQVIKLRDGEIRFKEIPSAEDRFLIEQRIRHQDSCGKKMWADFILRDYKEKFGTEATPESLQMKFTRAKAQIIWPDIIIKEIRKLKSDDERQQPGRIAKIGVAGSIKPNAGDIEELISDDKRLQLDRITKAANKDKVAESIKLNAGDVESILQQGEESQLPADEPSACWPYETCKFQMGLHGVQSHDGLYRHFPAESQPGGSGDQGVDYQHVVGGDAYCHGRFPERVVKDRDEDEVHIKKEEAPETSLYQHAAGQLNSGYMDHFYDEGVGES